MAELYPSNINSDVQGPNYKFIPGNNKIKSKFLSGPPQTRRRTTKRVDNHDITLRFVGDELAVFELWYKDTLKDGSSTFMFPHPRTKIDTEFKFSGEYEVANIGGDIWHVRFRLLEV